MDTAKTRTVIETTLARRGAGSDGSPIRVLTQYWTPEGEMLAEIDPCAKPLTPERRKIFSERLYARLGQMADVEPILDDLTDAME